MRTIFLTSVLIIGSILAVFAQSKSNVLSNNRSGMFILDKPFMGSMNDSLIKEKLQARFPGKNLYFQDSKDKELKMGKLPEGNYLAQRGMPIYKSMESFPMPVYRPDSTIRFFMQIKEYKKHTLIDFR